MAVEFKLRKYLLDLGLYFTGNSVATEYFKEGHLKSECSDKNSKAQLTSNLAHCRKDNGR